MKDVEKMVFGILKNVVLKSNKEKISLDANLREDLGIDSIKMIAIAAHLKEEGVDAVTGSKSYDFATIETVRDIVNIVNEITE